MLYPHYLELIAHIDSMVAAIDEQPDEAIQVQFTDLLRAIDLMHREGLVRLAVLLRSAGAGDALDRATTDPVVRTLLGLYGLAELDLPPEPAEDAREPAGPAPAAERVGFFPAERLTVRRTAPREAPEGE